MQNHSYFPSIVSVSAQAISTQLADWVALIKQLVSSLLEPVTNKLHGFCGR